MNVILLPVAQQELEEAVTFYEDQLKGLGHLFAREVFEAVDLIRLYPEGLQQITRRTRKCVLRKFPHMVLYGVVDGSIIISAIAHQHRRPSSYLR